MSADPGTPSPQERALFEAWAQSEGLFLGRAMRQDSPYLDVTTEIAWKAWRAQLARFSADGRPAPTLVRVK